MYGASVDADEYKAAASVARRARATIAARRTAMANEIDKGALNKGSVDDEAKASAARCAYVASAASTNDKATASAIEARAYDEGSGRDEAAPSAARCAYAAHVAADNDKAAASAPRRACTAIAALRTAEAGKINNRAHNKGSLDDEAEASAARRAYGACAASGNNKASASTGRRAYAAIAARLMAGGGNINDRAFGKGSDNDKAAESTVRRAYASTASNNDEALAPAARRVRVASAARGMDEGGYIVGGTSDEGSDNNKARPRQAPRGTLTLQAPPPSTMRQWPPPRGACAQQWRQGT